MSAGNQFILGVKTSDQGHEAQQTVPAWIIAILWVLAYSSCKPYTLSQRE